MYEKQSNGLAKLALSPEILKNLLVACTKDSPFRGPDGKLYIQKDGVAMGSPLGPLFANFYMAHVEEAALSNPQLTPTIYCRYVDDVFLEVRDDAHLHAIVRELEKNSVLKFTHERQKDSCLAFLDVLVQLTPDKFVTSVYVKPTNTGKTLNARSECPLKYKNSVLRAFITRSIKTSSTYELMSTEFNRVKQLLVNNGFTNTEIDQEIHKQLNKQHTQQRTDSTPDKAHVIYYKNHMNSQYKTDEKILKEILRKNIKCNRDDEQLRVNIYYQNRKTRQLVMKNSPTISKQTNRTNVVYKFVCPHEDCRPRNKHYIGATTTTLSRRLTMHIQEETGPVEHWLVKHQQKPTHKHLKENTEIIDTANDHYRLFIKEAIHITRHKPPLNIQLHTNISLALWGV